MVVQHNIAKQISVEILHRLELRNIRLEGVPIREFCQPQEGLFSGKSGPTMSLSPVSDTLAVTTLVYSLYKDVIKVAADAPQQFRDLSRDLQMIKGVLHQISRENNTSYGTALRNVLKTCLETLREFRGLTVKYEKLGKGSLDLPSLGLIDMIPSFKRSQSLVQTASVGSRPRQNQRFSG